MTLILAYTPAGTYTNHPALSEAIADLRQDLFDRTQNLPLTAAGTPTPPRWADDDLARALDRAVDEYSFVSPLVQAVMTATLPYTRAYAFPPGAWWIESVEYPTGVWPAQLVPFEESITPSLGTPPAASAVAAIGTGPLSGSYAWAVTFFKSGGETLPGALSAPLALSNGAGNLTIPLGPPGTIGRKIYRSKAGGPLGYVGQVLDNTSTSYVDTLADASVGAAPPVADTTANLPQVVLKLNQSRLPVDTSGILTVTYAGKHQLTTAGTSVPEQHHDIVLLGAAAYAMLAYQAPTNDLFDYQDGEMRDHVDERKVPAAWLAAGRRALSQFQERLEQVKGQRNAGVAAINQWGDVSIRWQRT